MACLGGWAGIPAGGEGLTAFRHDWHTRMTSLAMAPLMRRAAHNTPRHHCARAGDCAPLLSAHCLGTLAHLPPHRARTRRAPAAQHLAHIFTAHAWGTLYLARLR